jgi:hypothetical protein
MTNTAATLRQVVYDLMGDFKQLYADAEFTPYKILYWVLVHADRLRKEHILKIDSGAYTYPFIVNVLVDPINGRNYFELPAAIYDMDGDEGVDYICYDPAIDMDLPTFASNTFNRTTPERAVRLYFRDEETPSPSNPYFYRLNSRIYLLGTEQINLTSLEVGLKTTLNPNDVDMDIDQPFDFPQDLIPLLKRQVLDLGRFVLQIPRDLTNEGIPISNKGMPAQKLVSVDPQTNENSNTVE